ncbi:MAG: DUF2812 domain-containing protein [Clostridium sp.]
MSNKTKFIFGYGLAFSEEKDMNKLAKYSKAGWHLKAITAGGYILEKGEPNNYIYCVDYQKLKDEDKDEYFEMMNGGGWTLVKSYDDVIFLRAEEGTEKIYSDKISLAIKENRLVSQMGKNTISLIGIIALLILWQCTIGSSIGNRTINFVTYAVTGGVIGFTVAFIIGLLYMKLKANRCMR